MSDESPEQTEPSAYRSRACRRLVFIPHLVLAGRRHRRAAVASTAFVAAVSLATGAAARLDAAAVSSALTSAAIGEQLTYATTISPTTQNPALGASSDVADMSYDSLIYQTSTGKLVPQLAASWGYVGKARRVFVIKLRKGVRFSDGSRLTAEVLKDSLLYFKAAKGTWSTLATYDSVTVTGPLTVALHLTKQNPLMTLALSQFYAMGVPICPAFLRDPSRLTSQTCGAGPYALDAADTVPGDHYTLKQNPYYWNKSAVHYRRIVLRIIASPTSLLQAMRTGQVDVGQGDGSTVAAAQSAGLRTRGAPTSFTGIQFQDLNGELLKPLGDVRVRQALNYALDRKPITNVLFPTPGIGSPTQQPWLRGSEFWVPSYANRYPYDPAKAKQLLTAAGYPNGFTIEVVSTPLAQLDIVAQAVASYWQKIGVNVKLHSDAQASDYIRDLTSGKYVAYSMVWGGSPAWIQWGALLAPKATSGRNSFHIADAKIVTMVKRAEGAPAKEAAQLWQQIGKRWSSPAFVDT
jgi:peptide/nickel transport system substrate-binding protein